MRFLAPLAGLKSPHPSPLSRPILELQGGIKAHLAVILISAGGLATLPLKHRFLWKVCKLSSRFLKLKSESCVVEPWPSCKFKFLLADPYWAKLVAKSFRYEPDIEYVLYRLTNADYTFLDCGANYGYWSIFVSSGRIGTHHVLAVEADPENYNALMTNCELNGSRFRCLHLAVSREAGQQVAVQYTTGHAGAHIVAADSHQITENRKLVTTTTLDALLPECNASGARLLVVKLDIEGQEINAFLGAEKLLRDHDALFFYEDHADDASSEVTRFVLEKLALRVFYCRDRMRIIPIATAEEASRLKIMKTRGYNFTACRADSQFLQYLS